MFLSKPITFTGRVKTLEAKHSSFDRPVLWRIALRFNLSLTLQALLYRFGYLYLQSICQY